METLKTSETLDGGLMTLKFDGTQNLVEENSPGVFNSFSLGEEKCVESEPAAVTEKSFTECVNVEGSQLVSYPVAPEKEIGSENDSSTNVSTKGISLFVELTGRVKSDASGSLDDHVLLGNEFNGKNMFDVNSKLLQENPGKDAIGHQECRINVGNLVWAKTKKQSWWPGIICDPSREPKEVAKVKKRDDAILVKCFGNGSYIWCFPFQLKPFIECFEQFSKQSNTKSFVGALAKAETELALCTKREFTCSCFTKDASGGRGDIGDISVTQFEPATFVEYIKDLAREISMPSRIYFTVHQNLLSAFYQSLGHCQIPVHQLKPANDAQANSKAELCSGTESKVKNEEENGGNSNNGKSEKPYESRRRRKSRFCSFPYADLNSGLKGSPVSGEHGIEASKTELNGVDLKNSNDQSVKKLRKKRTRKPVTKHDVSGEGVEASICPSDVLSELQCAALDCFFPNESKSFYSVKTFFTAFRKWAFIPFTSENTIEQDGQEFGLEMRPQMENISGVNTSAGQSVPNVLPKRGRKKKDKNILSPMTENTTTCPQVVIDFQPGGSIAFEAQSLMEADPSFPQTEAVAAVSDLNRNGAIWNFGGPVVTEPPQYKPASKRRKKKEERNVPMHGLNSNFTGLPNMNGHVSPYLIQYVPQQNDFERLKEGTPFPLNDKVGLAPQCFMVNSSEPQLSNGPKKRGRKRKTVDSQANVGSTLIPDLNGNAAENEPQKKRGRKSKRTEEIGVPCIDLCYNKVQQNNDEVTGTALLLKFSPDYPLPSSDVLNYVFRKYGPLNESETQILNENLSGQVVFLDSSNAGEAFRSLEKDGPLGQALVNYRVQHLSSGQTTSGFKMPIKIPLGSRPLQHGVGLGPDLVIIRKNLEMMTSVLEKAGDTLLPEMREKLEGEIKGLMKKISTMCGSAAASSSSL